LDEDNTLSISDSVIQGNITTIGTSIQSSERVTCKACLASGNLIIFVCDEVACNNMFCEYCRDSNYPKKCQSCIKEINLKIQREREEMQRLTIEMERIKFNERLAEDGRIALKNAEDMAKQLEITRREHEIRMRHYNSTSAKLMRFWGLVVPVEQILCWLILYNFAIKFPSHLDTIFFYQSGLFVLTLFLTCLFAYLPMQSSDHRVSFLTLAETGYAPRRAAIVLLSPVISLVVSLIIILIFGIKILFWISIIIILLLISIAISKYA
jgi:hypothetical protein